MYKSILLITVITASLFISITVHSQPKAVLQFFGGYSLPLGDFKGTFGPSLEKFTGNGNPDSNSYFMKTGFNYGLSLKTLMGRKRNFYLEGGLSFNLFHQNVDYNLNTAYPENFKLRINITSIYFGAGWFFSPRRGLDPFLEAGLIGSYFSGSLDHTQNSVDTQLLLRGTFRLGLQAGAGIDIPIQYNVGLVFGAKFSFANILGRGYERDDTQNYSLNDKEYTLNNAVYPSRNITYLQLYGGVSFYFGK